MVAAGLIFFGFGFIGLEGGELAERFRNGWRAAVSLGAGRGLLYGAGIALGLAAATLLWKVLTDRFHPGRARPWLTAAAAGAVIAANWQVLRNDRWDETAVATVMAIAAVAAVTVWWVAPWVLRPVE